MSIGKVIRQVRRSKNISLKKLAKESGISISHLSFVERDMRDCTVRVLNNISFSLGVPTSFLFILSEKEILRELYPEFTKSSLVTILGDIFDDSIPNN